jgi:peptide/nickel transport system substrate-binding protein
MNRETPYRLISRLQLGLAALAASSLIAACAPPAQPAPTAAPAQPTTAAKPAEKPAAPAAAAPAPAAPAKAAPARVEPKGSVVLVLAEEPPIIAPHDATFTVSFPIIRNVSEALLNWDPKTNQFVPELATKWEQTNPTTWRFTLRQGVKFHDGTPWNAEAAADALTESWDRKNNYRVRQLVGPEVTAKPVSEYVLDLVTETPDPIMPARVYFTPFHSPTARKTHPEEYNTKPIGTGPYKMVEWVKGQHIKQTWNPDWWGNTATDNGGDATIKDITWVFRAEREVRTAMTQRGEADWGRWVSRDQCKAAPQCQGGPTVQTNFLRLDTMNPTLADKRVREGIALAVDKNAIMNDILDGGDPASMLIRPIVTGYNPELKPYPYDPARAKALIAEAKSAGVPVEAPLTLLVRRAAYFRVEEAGEAITDMLQKAGLINLKTQVVEVAKHNEIYSAPYSTIDPDRGIIALHSTGNDLRDFSQTVGSQYTCDGRNSTYCNPVVDEMQKNAQSLSGDERVKAYQAIGKYVYDEFVSIPIMHPSYYFALSQRLEWTPRPDGLILVKEMKLKE